MRCVGIYFDFRDQIRFGECLFQNDFVIGRTGIVICGDRDEKLRIAFRSLKMRTVRFIGHKSTAVE